MYIFVSIKNILYFEELNLNLHQIHGHIMLFTYLIT